MSVSDSQNPPVPCSLPRRIGAMVYDGLVLVAIWMVGAALVVVPAGGRIGSGNPLFQAWLLLLAFLYFHACWAWIGQTLGMRTWRIRLDPGLRALTLTRSLLRFAAGLASLATLGLGFAWALARDDRRAWPDLASASRLVVQR
ncbi:MAG: RDD family protein [Candidatus Wenzhouxiangella sp. M2_3B_020]